MPSGQTAQASVVGRSNYTLMTAQPAEFDIPADATEAQLWFLTSGRQCTNTWDSNFGENYRFAVTATRPQNALWAARPELFPHAASRPDAETLSEVEEMFFRAVGR